MTAIYPFPLPPVFTGNIIDVRVDQRKKITVMSLSGQARTHQKIQLKGLSNLCKDNIQSQS